MPTSPRNIAKEIINKLGREIACYVFKKSAKFPENYKVVSFTFDDFPISAIENGARILESYDVRGTFYATLGVADSYQLVGPIPSKQDMLNLSQGMHEIGCHTFSHIDCAFKQVDLIRSDCNENRKAAKQFFNISLQNFAYPYGSIDPLNKYTISKIYNSSRSIKPGINVNKIDLAFLRSVALYESYGWLSISQWLEKLDQHEGWLIFYTHDVLDSPSPFGCSIELFVKTIEFCRNKGFQILTVNQALKLSKKN